MARMKLWLGIAAVSLMVSSPASAAHPLNHGVAPGLGWSEDGSKKPDGVIYAAQPADRGNNPGLGWGKGGSKRPRPVPAQVAGVGLPVLAIAGAYVWYVRRKRRATRDDKSASA